VIEKRNIFAIGDWTTQIALKCLGKLDFSSGPRSHWGGAANREVKRLKLDHAFTFIDRVVFWVGEENWRSQGAMTKIGGIKREGLFTRELWGDRPYFIFEITKTRYEAGGLALLM